MEGFWYWVFGHRDKDLFYLLWGRVVSLLVCLLGWVEDSIECDSSGRIVWAVLRVVRAMKALLSEFMRVLCRGHPEEQFDAAASGRQLFCRTQRLQYPLIKEYTLNPMLRSRTQRGLGFRAAISLN